MEGYFNISGSNNAFDDFDIEEKKSFDEVGKKANESKFKPIGMAHTSDDAERKRLLDQKVDLNNGAIGYVFTVTGTSHSAQWKCHVCDMVFMGLKNLLFHERSMNHSSLMQASKHHASQFSRMEKKEGGEPGPPGVDEDEVEETEVLLTNIQSTLDDYKTSPLIGLEYVVELNEDYEKESSYVCMLCDKKGDPRTVMAHLISYNHRLKYLERHFPVTYSAINSLPKTIGARKGLAEIVLRISSEMEETFGRLRPMAADGRHFEEKRFSLMCAVNKSKHFIETPDKTFVHLVDRELLTTAAVKTDEIPIPDGSPPKKTADKSTDNKDEDDEIEFQGAFVKGTRVPANRHLRVRKLSTDGEEKSSIILTQSQKKPASDIKKEIDDCSLSSISSASSSPRPRYKRSRYSRSRSRSRSGSRAQRRRRSRSRSHSRRPYRRTKSRSPSRSRRSRSRSPYGGRRHQRSPRRTDAKNDRKRSKERVDDLSQEKARWEKFREDVAIVEKELLEKLAQHEKNPEKHPEYPTEWKLFWNRRYKELQQCGKDPNKHDFKPEWVEFWNKRMRELHEQDFMKKKEEIREKLGLPEDDPKPHYNRRKKFVREVDGHPVADSLGAVRGRSRSPSPWEEGAASGALHPRERDRVPYRQARADWRNERPRSPPRAITVLRMLTALETQLGSLGPRVNGMLSEAIALEKIQNGNSDTLLRDAQIVVLLETVREKFRGQLLAGIVERNMVFATRNAIGAIGEMLNNAPVLEQPARRLSPPRPPPVTPVAAVTSVTSIAPVVYNSVVPIVAPRLSVPTATPTPPPVAPVDPVTVPGVGAVDKAAIAREIATALIAQGKTDVSEEELQQLVAAVVGMAQAKAHSENATQANSQPLVEADSPKIEAALATPAAPVAPAKPDTVIPPQPTPEVSGLQLLRSAYDADETKGHQSKATTPGSPIMERSQEATTSKLPVTSETAPKTNDSSQTMTAAQAMDSFVEELTETDLRLLLQSFKDLPLDEQHGLIRYLKKLEATDPVKVERLRKYVNLGASNAPPKPPARPVIPAEKLQALAKVGQSGRLSPFSSRQQSRNPSKNEPSNHEALKFDSDSDDDYTFDDVCKAAKQKVSEQEAIEAEKKKEEEEKRKKIEEEMNRKLLEEKAKAEAALKEIEDREREQKRITKEKERLEREAAMKVGAANWASMNSKNCSLESLVPPVPPPPIPSTGLPPPNMQNMYSSYCDVNSSMGNYNGGQNYYASNSYNQQSGYYQDQQGNNAMYQQQAPPYNSQGYGVYNNNSMYQQNPQGQHQNYSVPPYGNQYQY